MTTKVMIGVAVAIALAIAYQSLVVVPQKAIEQKAEQVRLEKLQKEEEQRSRDLKYTMCRNSAYDEYSMNWESKCSLLKKGENCALTSFESSSIEDRYESELETCVTMYK